MRQLTAGFDAGSASTTFHRPAISSAFNVKDGAAYFSACCKRGVIVRPIGGYGMPAYLRVTIGLESENERFLDALAQSLAE